MEELHQKNIKFDRIDVSNISDENYLGMKKILQLTKPLLRNENPHARLMTTFMNWIASTEYTFYSTSSHRVEGAFKKNYTEKERKIK